MMTRVLIHIAAAIALITAVGCGKKTDAEAAKAPAGATKEAAEKAAEKLAAPAGETPEKTAEKAAPPADKPADKPAAGAGDKVSVSAEGTNFDPAVAKDRIPTGAWYCDMGTVHFARTAEGDGKCPRCGMKLHEMAAK